MNSKPTTSINRGAVLLSVLVLMLVLSFMLLSLSSVLDSRLSLAQSSNQLLIDKAGAYAKLQELTYLVATQRITRAGVSQGTNAAGLQRIEGQWASIVTGDELRMDGHVYVGPEGIQYYIQNETGLIPVNNPDQTWLKRWLAAYGKDLGEINQLSDSLYDYADADNWQRPAGAEKQDYARGGLPGPANFLLQSCSELHNVLNWQQFMMENSPAISECSLSRLSYLNINAVPIPLWEKLWPNSAAIVSESRNNGTWFVYPQDILSIAPSMLAVPEVYYVVLGGDVFITHVKKGNAEYSHRIKLGQDQLPPFTLRAIPSTERHSLLE